MKRVPSLVCLALFTGAIACSGDPDITSKDGTGANGSGNGNGSGSGNGTSGDGGFTLNMPTGTPMGGVPPAGNAPTEGMNCGLTKVDLQKRPAELMLVLDRSGSMAQRISRNNPAQRWPEVVGALNVVIERTQAAVHWGLKLFPVPNRCGVPAGVTVDSKENNHGAVMMAINANAPFYDGDMSSGATPTRAAVRAAADFLRMRMSPNPRYLVVATDGQPNCGPGGSSDDDDTGAVTAVRDAAAAGFQSFIVGIATGSGEHRTLNRMADAGGRPRADRETRYYPAASRDELAAALEAITGQIASCTFGLNQTPPVPDNVAVYVDGMRINQDTSMMNGWTYGPMNRSVVVHGPMCDQLKSGAKKNVQIIFGCPGAVIP